MSSLDILARLGAVGAGLTPLQRVLLTTDGTLTDILEAFLLEPIGLIKLEQTMALAAQHDDELAPETGENFLERKILLRGSKSARNFVYAESTIAIGRLAAALGQALLHSDTPLGRLWLEHRLETFKELI
nr:chorismate pyruvate-lyase family protein [Pseudomonadota bacterium]